MKRLNVFVTLLFAIINTCRGSEPAQLCHTNPRLHTDMCMALKSVKSQQRGHDLLITFSVKFHERSGWAAFGVGSLMDRALMFVLWPGEREGDVVLSLRSTLEHLEPKPLKNQRQVHVHNSELTSSGLHVVQATCFSCEINGLGALNASTDSQPWLFATSYLQQTQTNDPNLRINMHTDFGLGSINMAQALFANQNEDYPVVSADRSTVHAIDFSSATGSGGPSNQAASVNMWNVHGLLLSFSVILNFLGIVLIRSGVKWAFRVHLVLQLLSASGILIGSLIGMLKSSSIFRVESLTSMHKVFGVAITIGVPVQIALGYKHHLNYVKYGHRTTTSFYHIYLGRILFIALNLNVFVGLVHAGQGGTLRWIWGVLIILETAVLGWVIFAKRPNAGIVYQNVMGDDTDPFVIGDEEEKGEDFGSRS